MLTRYFKIMLNPFSHSCIKLQQLYQITWPVSCPTRPVLVDLKPVSTIKKDGHQQLKYFTRMTNVTFEPPILGKYCNKDTVIKILYSFRI